MVSPQWGGLGQAGREGCLPGGQLMQASERLREKLGPAHGREEREGPGWVLEP